MKKLPVGIQSFDRLIEDDFLYVDKTKLIYDLVSGKKGYNYFLSRPRRFGKSLLISTLKELFLGNKNSFEGLWISNSDYAWKKHPVIHLDFSAIASRTAHELRTHLSWKFDQISKSYGIADISSPTLEAKLETVIHELSKKARIVILIDEYDSPLLKHVNNIPLMHEIQEVLRTFYATIKAEARHIHFFFMTGITKFSKTSIFSGMNNLLDLTLSQDAADLTGYTDAEIDHYFQPYMQEIADKENIPTSDVKNAIKHWYNGYQFSQKPETVHNPFSVLMYLVTKDLRNYWFETGTPSFLVNLIRERKYSIEALEHAEINADSLNSFEVEKMQLIPLLLQTGYLTFKSYDPAAQNYRLGYPNEETKASFLLYFIQMIADTDTAHIKNITLKLTKALKANELKQFFEILNIFFASVPYNIQIAQEQYYQSIFYIVLTLIGAYAQAEVTTNNGRIDCTVVTDTDIYIFEFKLHDTAESALEQIEEKKYYQKYLLDGKNITLIGVAFDIKERNIGNWLSREHNIA